MIENFFKTGWRSILRKPFYSFVSIFGLSIGLAFTLLIAGFIWNEYQVNKTLRNAGNQYIVQSKWNNQGEGRQVTTIGALPKALYENYPDLVANYFRIDAVTSNVSRQENNFRETIAICDSTLLNMYGFPLLQGNAETAMKDPYTIVITERVAKKYFGKTDVVGETLMIENFSGDRHDFQITAVMKETPRNSVTDLGADLKFELFIPTVSHSFFKRGMSWENAHILGFIELKEGISPSRLDQPVQHLMKQHATPQMTAAMVPFLVPLDKYYMAANNGLAKKMVYALTSIALFILCMAIVNFINMSVSQSTARMREIGIRKVMGGLKRQLVLQFLTESVLVVSVAMLAALLICVGAKDLMSNVLGREIPRLSDYPAYFAVFPLLIALVTGCLAGLYPALVLSSFNPVASLKGKGSSFREKDWLKILLVGFQFGTAIAAVSGAIIIARQVNLFLNQDLGYDKDYIVSAQVPRNWTADGVQNMISARKRFEALPYLEAVSLSYEIPNGNNAGQARVFRADPEQAIPMQYLQSDENFSRVYQIPLLAGKYFQGGGSDSGRIVLNETASRMLGYAEPAEAIGQQIRMDHDEIVYTISGVLHDFHFGSMKQKIMPVVFVPVDFSNSYRFLAFKLPPGNISASIDNLQADWKKILSGAPFEYTFMDDTLKLMYKNELQLKKASYTASVLALMIVLTGILGLISLSIQKRRKEIAVRKVLGSSVASIILLFLKDFFRIIVIAAIIATPIAWFIMHQWLQEYAYRINLTITPFIWAVGGLALITGFLIGLQTMNSAMKSPAESLRSE